jgi:hypothetical protein
MQAAARLAVGLEIKLEELKSPQKTLLKGFVFSFNLRSVSVRSGDFPIVRPPGSLL